jgi:ATP-dependent Clp protease adaptor protein ClpS
VLRRLPPYHVILLDDDDHTHEYVVVMLLMLFGYQEEQCWEMARTVDRTGRCIVFTGSKEVAELKQDQIHAFGPDPWSSNDCKGSMTAVIEPAE